MKENKDTIVSKRIIMLKKNKIFNWGYFIKIDFQSQLVSMYAIVSYGMHYTPVSIYIGEGAERPQTSTAPKHRPRRNINHAETSTVQNPPFPPSEKILYIRVFFLHTTFS